MNFLELAEQVIKQVNQPLTSNEIWEKAVELGLDKKLNSKGKTPWATLAARLYVEIRDNPQTKFEIFGKRPTKFGLKNITQNTIINDNSTTNQIEKFTERDLHPLLVKFADTYYILEVQNSKQFSTKIQTKLKKAITNGYTLIW